MDCLRSFSLRINTNTNLSGVDISQWLGGAGVHNWSATTTSNSRFNIQGFKNINVFGVDLIGSVTTLPTAATGKVIVSDWNLEVNLAGQQALLSGNITAAPNYYGLNLASTTNTIYPIGRFSNSLKLESPVQSVQFIELGRTYAQGTGYETLASINLFWNLNLIVYYKFEGE